MKGIGLPSPLATPSVLLLPLNNLTFFGETLSCDTDLSGDGLNDLVIGSPFAQTLNGFQSGRTDVFFAATKEWAPKVTVNDANWTLLGSDAYEWTGSASAALANATSTLGVTHEEIIRSALGAQIEESTATAILRAPTRCAHIIAITQAELSSDTSKSTSTTAAALLLIGSTGFRTTTPELGRLEAGRVSAYLFPNPNSTTGALAACVRASPVALFSITADREGLAVEPMKAVKLGAAIALGFPLGYTAPPHFAIGMPCVDFCGSSALIPNSTQSVFNTSAGAVAIIPFSLALRGDFLWSIATTPGAPLFPRAMLASRLPDARFGWRLSFANVLPKVLPADDLIVSAPMYSRLFIGDVKDTPAPTPIGDSGREVGAIFIYKGGSTSFPTGSACAAENLSKWWAQGPVQFGRMGMSTVLFDWDGDGVDELVAGAPRAALDVGPQRREATVSDTGSEEYAGALLVYANFTASST